MREVTYIIAYESGNVKKNPWDYVENSSLYDEIAIKMGKRVDFFVVIC